MKTTLPKLAKLIGETVEALETLQGSVLPDGAEVELETCLLAYCNWLRSGGKAKQSLEIQIREETLRKLTADRKFAESKVSAAADETVTASRLAEFLGIAERTLRDRAEAGDIKKIGKDQYLLAESVRGYLEFLRTKKTNQHDGGSGESAGDYEAHRARLTGAKADIAQIEAEAMKGNFHEAGSVEAVWTDMLMNCRSKLLAIPSKLAPKLRKESGTVKIKSILETAVSDALAELSEYDPDRITSEYIQTHREDVATAPEVDGL